MALVDPRALIAEALNCAPESLGEASGLGQHPMWDSFGHLNLMIALEAQYGVPITDETIASYEHFGAVVRRFEELTGD